MLPTRPRDALDYVEASTQSERFRECLDVVYIRRGPAFSKTMIFDGLAALVWVFP
jgi:hypothetical protein